MIFHRVLAAAVAGTFFSVPCYAVQIFHGTIFATVTAGYVKYKDQSNNFRYTEDLTGSKFRIDFSINEVKNARDPDGHFYPLQLQGRYFLTLEIPYVGNFSRSNFDYLHSSANGGGIFGKSEFEQNGGVGSVRMTGQSNYYNDGWRTFFSYSGGTQSIGAMQGQGQLSDFDQEGPSPYTFSDINIMFDIERGLVFPAPVPEPATWATLLTGFAIVGSIARRKRAKRMARLLH